MLEYEVGRRIFGIGFGEARVEGECVEEGGRGYFASLRARQGRMVLTAKVSTPSFTLFTSAARTAPHSTASCPQARTRAAPVTRRAARDKLWGVEWGWGFNEVERGGIESERRDGGWGGEPVGQGGTGERQTSDGDMSRGSVTSSRKLGR